MKTKTALIAGGLAMVFAAGTALAQTSTPSTTTPSSPSMSSPSTSTDTTTAAPAKKPGMMSMPHHVTGQVVSADQANNTLTVKDSKGKDYTFAADKDAMPQLGTLKEGDRVKVTYKKNKDQMIATKIIEAQANTSKMK